MIETVQHLIRSNADKLIGSRNRGAERRPVLKLSEKALAALVLIACATVLIIWCSLLGYGVYRLIVWAAA